VRLFFFRNPSNALRFRYPQFSTLDPLPGEIYNRFCICRCCVIGERKRRRQRDARNVRHLATSSLSSPDNPRSVHCARNVLKLLRNCVCLASPESFAIKPSRPRKNHRIRLSVKSSSAATGGSDFRLCRFLNNGGCLPKRNCAPRPRDTPYATKDEESISIFLTQRRCSNLPVTD